MFFIVKQAGNCPGIDMLPSSNKRSNGHLGLSNTRGILDSMQITLNSLSIGLFYIVEYISALMGPTALYCALGSLFLGLNVHSNH